MDIESAILTIISKITSIRISDIHSQSYFIKDLNFTAFDFVEMLNLIEKDYNITFTAFEEPHIHTVDDIIKQVRLKLQ